MSMKKLFGVIVLIVGIIMVSTLIGCKEDEYTYNIVNNSSYTVTVMCKYFDPTSFTVNSKTSVVKTSSEDHGNVTKELQYTPGSLVKGEITNGSSKGTYNITFINK